MAGIKPGGTLGMEETYYGDDEGIERAISLFLLW
jgi:hypothetical protein